jgi:predicted negative regulator of RcsB-dependent stress response
MRSSDATPRPSSRKRWIVALGLLVIAISIGAVEARRRWSRPRATDEAQLGLLMAAWTEFNAKQFDRATGILNQRAEKVTPTPLDWMLRARIENAQKKFDLALAHLKKIPDSDPTGAQAWLLAGQIELARHHLRSSAARKRLTVNFGC